MDYILLELLAAQTILQLLKRGLRSKQEEEAHNSTAENKRAEINQDSPMIKFSGFVVASSP